MACMTELVGSIMHDDFVGWWAQQRIYSRRCSWSSCYEHNVLRIRIRIRIQEGKIRVKLLLDDWIPNIQHNY
jgi:hypothetical protein